MALVGLAMVAASSLAQDGTTPIIDALKRLESQSDSKCHSTFCRFEDFVYGTPMSEQARNERGVLQKDLIRALWEAASEEAKAQGDSRVSAALLQPLIEARLPTTRTDEGDLVLRAADGRDLLISRVRLRQYSSIAYSLRAVLGVQQDNLLFGAGLLPLEPDGVDALKNACDVATLATLMVADEAARVANAAHIEPAALADAWNRTVGDDQLAHADGRAIDTVEAKRIVLEMVEQKLAAYEAYNEIPRERVGPLLLVNTQRFYARYPVPRAQQNRDALLDTVNYTVDMFLNHLLTRAGELAAADGRDVIRASDANEALQELAPHYIDDFEDAHMFHHLGDDAVVLGAYDTDSFRDLGLHWWFLGRAYSSTLHDFAPVDPFAAEVVTEGVSQYAVLLLRLTGQIAEANGAAPVLLRSDIGAAKDKIIELAQRHHAAPARAPADTSLRSSADLAAAGGAFVDVSDRTGVDYVHRTSTWLGEFRRNRFEGPPTFSGGGVAAEDVDADGHIDLVFAGGGGVSLYLSVGDGTFVDATADAGITWRRADGTFAEARQPILADFDNDGHQDLLVTYANDAHRLYRGRGDATFEDVTARAGLGGEGLIGGPATVFDVDGDGLLDIYVCYFGNYLEGLVPTQDRDNQNALPNALLRNTGNFVFDDVTEGSGTADTGWAQAVGHLDFDGDGDQDIFIANDFGRNAMLENLGGFTFQNVAPGLGITPAYHSMNVGIADLNDDGHPDIYESNIALIVKDNKYVLPDPGKPLKFGYDKMATSIIKESNVLWMSRTEDERLAGYERATSIERGESSTGWAWDAEFFDYDLDGDDDLYVLNGSNEYLVFATRFMQDDNPNSERPAWQHLNHDRESNVFYVNQGGKLRNRSAESGANFYGNSRAAVYVDWDEDGDLDIAVNNFHAPVTMLENALEAPDRHWLKLRLVGDPDKGVNRDAIGAHVLITTDAGQRTHRFVLGGSGFLSMEPRLLHAGLGESNTATVTITWPNGVVQTIEHVDADQVHVIRQGE